MYRAVLDTYSCGELAFTRPSALEPALLLALTATTTLFFSPH
jgi:hypothetical protein